MKTMQDAYSVIQNHEQYRDIAPKLINKNSLIQGMPKDGFHTALQSHITRLDNRLKEIPMPKPQVLILRQRQSNMQKAKYLYLDMQKAILSPEHEQDKGRC